MTEPKIRKIAKIGTGVMGTNVAWACAVNGFDTYLYDQSEDQLNKSMERLQRWLFDGSLSDQKAQQALERLDFLDEGINLAMFDLPYTDDEIILDDYDYQQDGYDDDFDEDDIGLENFDFDDDLWLE